MRRLLAFLLIFCCLCLSGCAEETGDAEVRLAALNVGKGDCLLLLLGEDAYLIDSGYDYTSNLLMEALRQYGVSRLRGVFLSHCDKDHSGGLMPLALSDVAVDAWYAASIYYDVPEGQHPAVLAAAARNAEVTWLSAGDTLTLGDGASLRVLGPLTVNVDNENNNSLVFLVETRQGDLLFTGDMKLEEEAALLEAGAIPPADLLKVPFHGDNTASSLSFVDAVHPAAALICTSTAQEPDTPASSILKRYSKAGADVYVTQDYAWGIEMSLSAGRVKAEALHWDLPDWSKAVTAEIDPAEDLLILRSASDADISLEGWIVHSTKGSECVVLPEGAMLPAGGTYTLGSRATKADCDLRADTKRMWHKSKLDAAWIYDSHGGLAAVTDNGNPE